MASVRNWPRGPQHPGHEVTRSGPQDLFREGLTAKGAEGLTAAAPPAPPAPPAGAAGLSSGADGLVATRAMPTRASTRLSLCCRCAPDHRPAVACKRLLFTRAGLRGTLEARGRRRVACVVRVFVVFASVCQSVVVCASLVVWCSEMWCVNIGSAERAAARSTHDFSQAQLRVPATGPQSRSDQILVHLSRYITLCGRLLHGGL